MVTTYMDNYNAAHVSPFVAALSAAVVDAAIDIQAEDETGLTLPVGAPSTLDVQGLHNVRSALAYRVLNDASGYAHRFAPGVVDNLDLYPNSAMTEVYKADTEIAPTKAEIKNAVSAVWNAYALDCLAV